MTARKWMCLLLVGLLPAIVHAEGKPGGKDSFDPDQLRNFTRKETIRPGIEANINAVGYHKFHSEVETVLNWAVGDIRRVAFLFDPSNPGSDLSRLNAEAGSKPVKVSKETIQLLGLAKKMRQDTNGAFDIVEDAGASASDIKINKTAMTVQFGKPSMKIRVENVLDGYLTDLLLVNLWNANIDSALVQIGGAARSVGRDVVGSWRLTIADVTGRYASRGITLSFSNLSSATVGVGKRAPTIDYRTKQPLTPPCRGATVIARDAATSMAIANAVYILGPTDGLKLAQKIAGRAVVMGNDGSIVKSPGL